MLLVVAGLSAVRLGGDEEGSVATVSTSSTLTTTTSSTTPTDPASIVGLPSHGIAVQVKNGVVVLLGFDGKVIDELRGFELHPAQDAGTNEMPGPLVLRRDGDYHLIADGGVKPLPISDENVAVPLAYNAELVTNVLRDPGRMRVRRRGEFLMDLQSGIVAASRVSYDRDIVSLDTFDGSNHALDLLTGKVKALPGRCHVADRHGQRWYLACETIVRAGFETEPMPVEIFDSVAPEGTWEKAMVSPDGERLLLEWWKDDVITTYVASAFTGGPTPLVAGRSSRPLGWTPDGRTAVLAADGVYVSDTLVWRPPAGTEAVRAAMWAPALR